MKVRGAWIIDLDPVGMCMILVAECVHGWDTRSALALGLECPIHYEEDRTGDLDIDYEGPDLIADSLLRGVEQDPDNPLVVAAQPG